MKRAEMLEATESILKRAGFQVSERCVARPSCFDFAARREKNLAFVKVLNDVGSISIKDASELQNISGCFSATPFFVSGRNRRKPLEDDTVYIRYNLCTITCKTLEDMIFREMYPLVVAGPGGYYVNLDRNIIRERRQRLGLSVGKLGEMIGISRRTLYGYEKGMAKASVSVAYNLEWVLGIPVVQPVNVFQRNLGGTGVFATARRMVIKNRVLQAVLGRFAHFNFRVAPIGKAPFDFIAQLPGGQLNIVGGVADKRGRNVDQRAREIMSVSGVADARPVFITDGEQVPNNDIPLIHCDELDKMKCSEELIARL